MPEPRTCYTAMTTMQKAYFISAWVVAGLAVLSAILSLAGWWGWISGASAFGALCETLFLGIGGCFALLYLSGWFRNGTVLFIMAWVVAGLALLAIILQSIGGTPVAAEIGNILAIVFVALFLVMLLLFFSGRFSGDR